jgi:protein-disulfide isomerase
VTHLWLAYAAGLALVGAAITGTTVRLQPGVPNDPSVGRQQAASPQPGGIAIEDLGHDRGPRVASNWVAEFLDLGCGYCARFSAETFPSLDKEFVATGKIRWKAVTFVSGMFPHSEDAAVAAECAADQGKFFEMQDSLLAARKEWIPSKNPQLVFARVAKRLSLDQSVFGKCASGNAARLRIRKQTMVANQISIRGTPTFFINGRRVEGAIPLPLFRQVLAENTR